jgi:sulfatase modifying factor 1
MKNKSLEIMKDPEGPKAGSFRVLRGGSWYNFAQFLRSANRGYFYPELRYVNVGFRLIRISKQEKL